MEQHNPPHPGEVLWGLDMQPAGLTVTAVAARIGVDRKTLSRIINGRAGISAEMAIRLGKVFRTTPDLWLTMQSNYDLWQAKHRIEPETSKLQPFFERGAEAYC